jgi:hypothetical protein
MNTTRKSARLQKLNETDRQSVSPTNPAEFTGMTSILLGTGTDHSTQNMDMEPQPIDSSIPTSQVETEDPNPSEEKEAVTVVDLTKEEAVENPTRSYTPIEEDWEVATFEGEEGAVAAAKEDGSRQPKKIFAKDEKFKPFRPGYSHSPKKTNPKPTNPTSRLRHHQHLPLIPSLISTYPLYKPTPTSKNSPKPTFARFKLVSKQQKKNAYAKKPKKKQQNERQKKKRNANGKKKKNVDRRKSNAKSKKQHKKNDRRS